MLKNGAESGKSGRDRRRAEPPNRSAIAVSCQPLAGETGGVPPWTPIHTFGDPAADAELRANLMGAVKHHRPPQARHFTGSEASLKAEEHDDVVSLGMPVPGNERAQSTHVIRLQRFGSL